MLELARRPGARRGVALLATAASSAALGVAAIAYASKADSQIPAGPAGVYGAQPALHDQRSRGHSKNKKSKFSNLPGGVSRSTLEAIAACESHGDPTAIGGGGAYRGKYQFDYSTWASVGGKGDPVAASEAEQDYRAALLYARSGPGPWPVCGA